MPGVLGPLVSAVFVSELCVPSWQESARSCTTPQHMRNERVKGKRLMHLSTSVCMMACWGPAAHGKRPPLGDLRNAQKRCVG